MVVMMTVEEEEEQEAVPMCLVLIDWCGVVDLVAWVWLGGLLRHGDA